VRIAVARDQAPGEARVAMVPDLVGRLRAAGYEVAVQAGAGVAALLADEAYEAAGAQVTEHAFDEADVVLSVQPLDAACLAPSGPPMWRCGGTGSSPPSAWSTCRGSRARNRWMP